MLVTIKQYSNGHETVDTTNVGSTNDVKLIIKGIQNGIRSNPTLSAQIQYEIAGMTMQVDVNRLGASDPYSV